MIEVNHTLLSEEALENLLIEIITRQATEYGEYEIDIAVKKNQLKGKLHSKEAVIVYSSKEEVCDIISQKEFQAFQKALL
jgi:hypothetical protein